MKKQCRFIPDVSVTVQNQVIDLNRLLHNVDPYLKQQYLRLGTYNPNVNLDTDPDIFYRRDFDLCDVFEYEKAINSAAFMQQAHPGNVNQNGDPQNQERREAPVQDQNRSMAFPDGGSQSQSNFGGQSSSNSAVQQNESFGGAGFERK